MWCHGVAEQAFLRGSWAGDEFEGGARGAAVGMGGLTSSAYKLGQVR